MAIAQDPTIMTFTDKTSYIIGDDATLNLSAMAMNLGPEITLDVHLAIIAPGGAIYELPDMNTSLNPWFPNLTLPSFFMFGPASLGSFSIGSFPLNQAGDYVAAAAYTRPGTLEFVGELAWTPFTIMNQGTSAGSYGHLYLDWSKSFDELAPDGEVWVMAGGLFFEVYEEERRREALDKDEMEYGCEVTTWDWENGGETTYSKYLDAGAKLDMFGSPLGTVALPKFSYMDMIQYYPADEMVEGHYSGGSNYTFEGYGGPDVGAFTVSVVAPAPVVLYAPTLYPVPEINRSQDLNVSWEGTGVGDVFVSITSYDIDQMTQEPTSVTQCSCRFVDNGQGTVPASLLSQLPPSPSVEWYLPSFSISRQAETAFSASGLTELSTAYASASVQGNVDLQ